MSQRRRSRIASKWTGTVITVSLLTVWVSSAWHGCGYFGDSQFFGVSRGRMNLVWIQPRSASGAWIQGWRFRKQHLPFLWWFECDFAKSWISIVVPLWFPALLTGVPTALMWRRDFRRRRAERKNVCPECGYSRTGLPPGRACPECGTPLGRDTLSSST